MRNIIFDFMRMFPVKRLAAGACHIQASVFLASSEKEIKSGRRLFAGKTFSQFHYNSSAATIIYSTRTERGSVVMS